MKIMILGINGFLGSSIAQSCIGAGHKVIGVAHNLNNISRISDIKDKMTMISAKEVLDNIADLNPDVIINTVTVYERNNVDVRKVIAANLEYPLTILENTVRHKKLTWLNAGTSLADNLNCYSLAKKQLSSWGKMFAGMGEVNFINMQLEHLYGIGAANNNFITWLISKMIKDEDIELTQGLQHRDFIYIKDVNDIVLQLIDKDINGYLNLPIGTGESPQLRDVIEFLKTTLNSKSKLLFGAVPYRKNEPSYYCDTAEMDRLGLKCSYTWQTGMTEMIQDILRGQTK